MKNLEKMSLSDLQKLQNKISVMLEKNIFKLAGEIENLQLKRDIVCVPIDQQIDMLQSNSLYKNIRDLGYLIVFHDFNHISIISPTMPIIDRNYYGFGYFKNKGLVKLYDSVSDEDFEIINNILKGV